jgi:hypothetical protein
VRRAAAVAIGPWRATVTCWWARDALWMGFCIVFRNSLPRATHALRYTFVVSNRGGSRQVPFFRLHVFREGFAESRSRQTVRQERICLCREEPSHDKVGVSRSECKLYVPKNVWMFTHVADRISFFISCVAYIFWYILDAKHGITWFNQAKWLGLIMFYFYARIWSTRLTHRFWYMDTLPG